MPHTYSKNRKEYPPEVLREHCVKLLFFGLEARVDDIAQLLGISKQAVYKIIRKLSKK